MRTERERRDISVISSTREHVVAEGEKQEKGRRRGREKKYLTLLMSTNTNTGERDIKQGRHLFPKIIPQFSYSLKEDIHRRANCAHLTQKSGKAGHSPTITRSYPPLTSSCSCQNVFLQGEWGRQEILAWSAQNEGKRLLEKKTSGK